MKQLHQNLYVAGQISALDFEHIKSSGITTIINNRPDNEEAGQYSSDDAAEVAKQHGIDYHYLPMANGQAMPETLVDDFKRIIDSAEGAVLAHCRSGMRSSFIWALGEIPTGAVTVDQAIEKANSAGIPLGNARAVLETLEINS